jgi:hypothetical protein
MSRQLPKAVRSSGHTSVAAVMHTLITPARRAAHITRRVLDPARIPTWPAVLVGLPRLAWRTAELIVSQTLVAGPLSPLMKHRSPDRRFEAHWLSRRKAQLAARLLGGDVNVLFIAGLAGALGAYHEQLGAPCQQLRMAMPIGLHGGSDLNGNHFTPFRLVIPTDPAPRFGAIADLVARARTEPALWLTEPVAQLINLLPDAVVVPAIRAQARSVDFTASLLPGPRGEHRWAGARILASYPFGPLFAAAINATALTLGDRLQIGVHRDPAAVADPALFMKCLSDSFDTLIDQSG